MDLIDKVEGRTFSISIYARLKPPKTNEVGETDSASEVAREIVEDIKKMFEKIAEEEGFSIKFSADITVY